MYEWVNSTHVTPNFAESRALSQAKTTRGLVVLASVLALSYPWNSTTTITNTRDKFNRLAKIGLVNRCFVFSYKLCSTHHHNVFSNHKALHPIESGRSPKLKWPFSTLLRKLFSLIWPISYLIIESALRGKQKNKSENNVSFFSFHCQASNIYQTSISKPML